MLHYKKKYFNGKGLRLIIKNVIRTFFFPMEANFNKKCVLVKKIKNFFKE